MSEPRVLENWIDGAPVPPLAGGYLDSPNPATGEVGARVPRSGTEDVEAAVAAARAAAPGWAATPAAARAAVLERVADGIRARADELAAAESADQGKPVTLAAAVDIPRSEENFRFFARAVQQHEERAYHLEPSTLSYTRRAPVGVAGLISPWNLPLYLLTWKLAPALATGNTCVAKPSELTSVTASLLGEVLRDAGVPPGVANLVLGTGGEAGAPLVAHPEVPLVSFTGGTATGAQVAATAAPLFKKVSLELGGKNPTLVFADADLDAAVAGAVRAGFTNQGEICLCGSRVLVEASIYDEFLTRFVPAVEALVVGDPRDPASNLGALVSAGHRDKVEGFVAQARDLGGEVRCGGRRPDLPGALAGGSFYLPTVITGLDQGCPVVQEEIFGPVVTLQPFGDEAEAMALANGVRYGLSASIWTSDLARGHRVAAALEAGTVWLNTWMRRDLRVPFGGVKASGVGREGGEHSIDFFTEVKTVCLDHGGAR